jgi:HAD superfamily hydrolase (TIGR01509 family)
MQGFDALIFDVDGTLADSERDGHRCAFNAAFSEVGLDWSWSEDLYGELLRVTGGKERIRYYMERWRPAVGERANLDEFIADLHRRKTRHYLEMRLLRQAHDAGVRLAVATTTTPENVTKLLECSGGPEVPSWFEAIAAGDLVPEKKPAPDIYNLVLAQLGLPATACVAVEDSGNGVRAALGAGLRALLVTANVYTMEDDFSGAALVTDGLGEPDLPVKLLLGSLEESAYIDLAALDAMHRRVYAGG